MNKTFCAALGLFFLSGAIGEVSAQNGVNDLVVLGPEGSIPIFDGNSLQYLDGNGLTVFDDSPQGNSNGLALTVTTDNNGLSLAFNDLSAGHPIAFYSVANGSRFDDDYVNENPAVISNGITGTSPYYFITGTLSISANTPFYLGIWKGLPPGAGPGPRYIANTTDSYGWAEFTYDPSASGSKLQLLDNESSPAASGIIVGTTTVIPTPEPGVFALLAGGLSVLALYQSTRKFRLLGQDRG